MQALDALARRLVHPAARLRASEQDLAHLGARLGMALGRRIEGHAARLEALSMALASLNPQAVLARACEQRDYAALLHALGEARHGVAATWAELFGETLEIET